MPPRRNGGVAVHEPHIVVWSRASESWGADCEVTPVDFELKENRGKLTELLSVGKLNLPSRWELEKLTVTTKFDGNERSYHRYVEETLGKLKSQHAIDFVTIPLHAWVKKALAIQSKSHLLTPEVGGTYNEDATVEAALSPPSKKLLRHVVGLINHAKYVYGVVYRALTSTLDSEQHVKKMVETQLSTLADAFPDGTPLSDHEMADGKIKNEEQMGSVADSYALWIMLRNKYQRKHHVHVRELLDTLSATRCEANTRDAVKLFYTKLVTIEQEIRLIQGLAAEKKTLYLGLVDLRRRDGLTETLLRQLRKEELMRKWECEGKELAEWAEKMVIVYDEETSNQQSAPVSAVTKEGHKATQAPAKSKPFAGRANSVRPADSTRAQASMNFPGVDSHRRGGNEAIRWSKCGEREAREQPPTAAKEKAARSRPKSSRPTVSCWRQCRNKSNN
jgi:hypothetical protein